MRSPINSPPKKGPFKEPLFSHIVFPDFPPNRIGLLRLIISPDSFALAKRSF
jgi:hypothetical protein